MKDLIEILKSNDFETEKKDSVLYCYMNNYFAFKINQRKNGNIDITFNGMKTVFGRSKTENKEYNIFIKLLDDNFKNYYQKNNSGVVIIKNIQKSLLKEIIEKCELKKLFQRLISFQGLWCDYILKKINFNNKTCIFRDNKNEAAIVREAFTANTYEHNGMTFEKDDIVLDLGANIGCFTLSVFDRVKQVIAVEPEKHNCEIADLNIKENNINNCIFYQAAVVGNNDKERTLYCGWCAGMYSLHTNTHQRVSVNIKCVNIQDLIDKYNPTKIKFDIKGSEIECVHGIKDWKRVNQVAFDYCFDINGDLTNQYKVFNDFKAKLKKDGFDITPMERDMKSNWNLVFVLNRQR